MVGTMMVSKGLLDRFRAAFKRYGTQVLDDPDITIDFFASETGLHLEVVLGSPKFQNKQLGENYDSLWNFLHADSELTNDELFLISYTRFQPEHVEFI
jgi:hypothetical protein